MMAPSLSLDFTSAVLDPRITFARAGATATRVNASGFVESVPADTARFDFNPLTLACRGLLVEELRQNLAFPSEDFIDTSKWFRTQLASVNQDVEVAPTNTQVADSIIENTASGTHLINCVFTGAISSYALSVFAKKLSVGNARRLVIREGVQTGAQACFDLTAGTVVGTAGGGSPSASIQSFGNGWYRCVLVFNNAASGTRNMQLAITRPTASSLDTYTGDGVSGLALFGAQVEAGAFATNYIPTTSAAVTRNADVVTIAGLGSVPQGTFMVDATVQNGSTLLTSGGVTFAATASTAQKNAVAYDADSTLRSINSGAVTVSAGATGGADITFGNGGHFRALEFWDRKLLAAELQVASSSAGRRSIIQPVFNRII